MKTKSIFVLTAMVAMAFFGCNSVTKFVAATNIQFTSGDTGMSFDALKTATGLPSSLSRSVS
jgi:FlaG/FlaF family flagellin (archaellin)